MLGVAFSWDRKRFSIWLRNEELQKMTKPDARALPPSVTHIFCCKVFVCSVYKDALMVIVMTLTGLSDHRLMLSHAQLRRRQCTMQRTYQIECYDCSIILSSIKVIDVLLH